MPGVAYRVKRMRAPCVIPRTGGYVRVCAYRTERICSRCGGVGRASGLAPTDPANAADSQPGPRSGGRRCARLHPGPHEPPWWPHSYATCGTPPGSRLTAVRSTSAMQRCSAVSMACPRSGPSTGRSLPSLSNSPLISRGFREGEVHRLGPILRTGGQRERPEGHRAPASPSARQIRTTRDIRALKRPPPRPGGARRSGLDRARSDSNHAKRSHTR